MKIDFQEALASPLPVRPIRARPTRTDSLIAVIVEDDWAPGVMSFEAVDALMDMFRELRVSNAN